MAGRKLGAAFGVLALAYLLVSVTQLLDEAPRWQASHGVALGEDADLCATQAVKLDDCLPKSPKLPGHFTSYRVGNKLVPWKTVKTAVKTDPSKVLQTVEKQTEATRDRLNSIQAKEVMQEDFIQQTQRRLEAAKKEMSRLLSTAHPPSPKSTDRKSRSGGTSRTAGPGGAAAGGKREVSKSGTSLVLETALATSLAAEQNEIASLKRRLKLLARARRAGEKAKKMATGNSSAAGSLQNLTAATSSLSHLLGSAEKKWMSVRKKTAKDPREEEDNQLEKQAQEHMKWQEAALVQEEKDEQKRIKQMNSWSRQLVHGGLNRIGFDEYGVGKAMKRMRKKKEEKTMPQKLQVSARKEARQLRKAGVSESDILGTFHLYESPSDSSSPRPSNSHLSRHAHLLHLLSHSKSKSQEPSDVSDLKAMQKVGKISAATEARASEAVQSIIDGKGKQAIHASTKKLSPLKIDVYPGSLRPLRTKVNPTSIKFWKQLDSSDVHFHHTRGREGDPAHLLQ